MKTAAIPAWSPCAKYKIGQVVYSPKFDYQGPIVAIWPSTSTQPDRVWIKKDGDSYGRTVLLTEIEQPR